MKFKYKARTVGGSEQDGKIEASSKDKAVEILQKHRLVIVSIDPIQELFDFSKYLSKIRKVNSRKIVMFSKELAILLSSGVSLVEALKIEYEQEESVFFREQIFSIASMVEDGDSFSSALSHFPDTFSDFFVNIVRSGEISGKMQESLLHLADYVEKSYLLFAGLILAAYIYVFGMIVFGLLSLWGLIIFLSLPKAWSLVRSFKEKMPDMADALTAQFDTAFGILLLLALFLGRVVAL